MLKQWFLCNSGSLLNISSAETGISESNSSSELDSCTDEALGTYHMEYDIIQISILDDGDF